MVTGKVRRSAGSSCLFMSCQGRAVIGGGHLGAQQGRTFSQQKVGFVGFRNDIRGGKTQSY